MRPVILALLSLAIAGESVSAQGVRSKHGFTAAAGVGAGLASISCQACNHRQYTAPSAFLGAGFFLDSSLSLNVQARAWRKVADDDVAQLAMALVGLQGHPFKDRRFYAEGGLGFGTVSLRRPSTGDKISSATAAMSLGLGYNVRIRPGLSAAPFLNMMSVASGQARLNGQPSGRMSGSVYQLGVALSLEHFNRRRYIPLGGR